jgi:hypothetical protein
MRYGYPLRSKKQAIAGPVHTPCGERRASLLDARWQAWWWVAYRHSGADPVEHLAPSGGLPLAVGAWVAEGMSPPIRVAVSEARDGD